MDPREKIGIFLYSRMKLRNAFSLRQIFANCYTRYGKINRIFCIGIFAIGISTSSAFVYWNSFCLFADLMLFSHFFFLSIFLYIFLSFYCILQFFNLLRVHYNKYLCATRDATMIVYTFSFAATDYFISV